MKKPYEGPKMIIELFLGHDIITWSGGGNPGGEGGWDDDDDNPIGNNDSGP